MELNITAFLNLMVILVPFLLITAVFSRMTVLDLNLPVASQSSPNKPNKRDLQLEIIVRQSWIDVADTRRGLIKRIRNNQSGHDYKTLSGVLQRIKASYPDKDSATILAERDTSYDTIVQTMDAVRSADVVQAGSVYRAELFPEISIGDAPASGRRRR